MTEMNAGRWVTAGIQAIALIGLLFVMPTSARAQAESPFPLTPEERAWLDAHPRIRLAPAPNFPPIEFFDGDGTYRGLMADYAATLEARLGIEFEVVQHDSWQDVVTETMARNVDVWMEAQESDERREFMDFTRPYVILPAVIIVRTDTSGTLELSELGGMRVAVVEGYASSEYVREHHPGLDLVRVPSVEVGLARVSFGAADALVANVGTASHFIEKYGMTNLRVAGVSGFEWQLCLATRNDWPELHDLLQRALDTIDPAERQEMYRRWIVLEQTSLLARREFWIVALSGLAAMVIIVTAVVVWNRVLKRQVAARTEELRAELARRRSVETAVTGSTLELSGAAAQIAASARQQEGTIRAFHESTNRAATAIQEISATGKHLVQIIEETDRVARNTAQKAESSQDNLQSLDAAMGRMAEATAEVAETIQRIHESTSRINLATNTMTRVVDRTDVLSINASIEAEKAGAHARGFRVVASEMRRLAGESAEATLEIESVVTGIHESVARGVDLVSRFGDQMSNGVDEVHRIATELGQIITDVARLSSRFAEISQMMPMQASGTDEVHESIDQINRGARQISDSSAEFAHVTRQLEGVAGQLKGQVSSFAEAATVKSDGRACPVPPEGTEPGG